MQKPRTQGPVPPARTGLDPGDSDEGLAAALRTGDGDAETRTVAVLLARHWQPVFDYASIGTPSAKAASMLATAAFNKVLENLRHARTTAALRPLLLLTARQTAKAWAADERVTALPELQNPETGRTVPVDMFTLAENRALVARSFQAMPGPAQCLLWHVEVEAEGISVPAGLLATDARTAAGQLDQAREIFRVGILRSHLELTQDKECRHYNRLLDVSLRRGGTLIPDIQAHLATCRHCRFAAEQLDHGGGRLALLLAEGLLGWAAQPYLDSRPARNNARYQARAAAVHGPARGPGRHSRGGPARALFPLTFRGRRITLPQRGRGAVLTGLGVVAGLLVVATLVTQLWADDGGTAGPPAPSGSVSAPPVPGGQAPTAPGPQPSTTSAAHPTGPFSTRLRNTVAGLCLDIRDRRAQFGTEATMAACTTSVTQQWVYENDGLLRSGAALELCLNSHELDGVLVLGSCPGTSAPDASDVRYDLTIQGHVVPRWNESLAVVPSSTEAGAPVVVKVRDGSAAQQWATDNVAVGTPRMRPSADAPNTQEVNGPSGRGRSSAPADGEQHTSEGRTRQGVPDADLRSVSDDGGAAAPDGTAQAAILPALEPALHQVPAAVGGLVEAVDRGVLEPAGSLLRTEEATPAGG
ncbi:RICIN domain-containing protein [Streptomyces sp. NPDC008141]|uniref:RICIN domain-containing protein n=1 Tax=Streptomyces sp. NPDC008141 TaxID=3364815 RepID=UPI0036E2D6B4